MSSNTIPEPAVRHWHIVSRWHEYEGEARANLLRIAGIGAFYLVELLKAGKCWLCGAAVQEDWETVGPGHIPMGLPVSRGPVRRGAQTARSPARFQFGLSTLLLVVTMFAIICSVWRMAPGLGAVLALVVMFGFIGVTKRSMTAAAEGVPLGREQKIRAFLRWAGTTVVVLVLITAVIGLAIGVAFLIMCSGSSGGFH